MTKSIITVKYQTTVPKEVREKLKVGPSDVLQWEVVGDHARVTVTSTDLLSLKGRFKVGAGDPVEDVKRARERMGTEDR
jgi:bifunctional DNA-binding transcriptional regulator/antitoxin component of YhaV-PrlF toxin-antitoxin module